MSSMLRSCWRRHTPPVGKEVVQGLVAGTVDRVDLDVEAAVAAAAAAAAAWVVALVDTARKEVPGVAAPEEQVVWTVWAARRAGRTA